jgi:hypothetical protein
MKVTIRQNPYVRIKEVERNGEIYYVEQVMEHEIDDKLYYAEKRLYEADEEWLEMMK